MENNKKRNTLERWLDRHNHTMAMMRTLFSLTAAITGTLIFLKVFNLLPS